INNYMKAFVNLLNSLLLAVWVIAIAIFSIQNIQAVSLKFLIFESITVPVGVLLAFFSGIGMILGWFIPLLLARQAKMRNNSLN
ncbi:MAG: lipopolysaccharide assembly protein LapA domain-containing protein, partial [Waterburya sp.]